jgi:photosystem II stability/assembly factor-like uncharacterized protein
MWLSRDDGAHWQQAMEFGLNPSVLDAKAIGSGSVYVQLDSGRAFYALDSIAAFVDLFSKLGDRCFDLERMADNSLYVAGSKAVYRSSDRGKTWGAVPGVTGCNNASKFVSTSPSTVLLTDTLGVVRSSDGGMTWSRTLQGEPTTSLFTTSTSGILGIMQDGIYHSSDFGSTWAKVFSKEEGDLQSILDNKHGVILVGTGSVGVCSSADQGLTWQAHDFPVLVYCPRSFALNKKGGMFASDGSVLLLYSTDHGVTWVQRTRPVAAGQYRLNYQTDSNNNLYCVDYQFYRSTDDGITWKMFSPGNVFETGSDRLTYPTSRFLIDKTGTYYYVSSDPAMWGTGFAWAVYRSDDSCRTSTRISDTILKDSKGNWAYWLNDIAFDSSGGLLAGTLDAVFRTTDRGETWTRLPGLPPDNSYTISVGSTGCIYAQSLTSRGGLQQSTDNGQTWEILQIPPGVDLRGAGTPIPWGPTGVLCGFSESKASLCLYEGIPPHATVILDGFIGNYGIQFLLDSRGSVFVLVDTLGSDNHLHYAFYRKSSPLTAVATNLEAKLSSYSLAQNYPNPFNPSTTIRYELPKTSYVTLKVYNTLGQEVAELVNGVQELGYKSVGWNAGAVASGVYFYRLQAGDFVQTRKLLVLR